MFLLVLFLFFVASPVLPSVLLDEVHSCSVNEYFCEDGGCISSDLVCDGRKNCADGSDEVSCGIDSITLSRKGNVLNRSKRQTSGCRRNQWPCRDGACIPFDEKCDGAVNCPDGSDETHALCRKSKCQHNWFRCTYGACVDGTAPCNGVSECADSSDELLPRCRNETDDYRGQFRCADGTSIPAANYCDGAADCPDGSDETVRACAAKTCPTYLFQCAYGACVDSGADCNGIQECADGSDEAADLCNKSGSVPLNRPTTSTSATVDRPRPTQGGCVLPDQPAHGSYKSNIPNGRPGDGYDYVVLTVSCVQGYGTVGNNSVICAEGYWSTPVPQCVRMCKLTEHPSVTFTCKYKNENYRACNEYEPSGTVVKPECRYPNYYSTKTLQYMRCIEGQWDYVARCSPGLVKTGTNITVLVKEEVEIYVGDIKYAIPIKNEGDKAEIDGINKPQNINTDNNINAIGLSIKDDKGSKQEEINEVNKPNMIAAEDTTTPIYIEEDILKQVFGDSTVSQNKDIVTKNETAPIFIDKDILQQVFGDNNAHKDKKPSSDNYEIDERMGDSASNSLSKVGNFILNNTKVSVNVTDGKVRIETSNGIVFQN